MAAVGSCSSPAPKTAPTGKTAPGFTTAGGDIIGPDGKPFVAHGVNVNGYRWVWDRSTVDDLNLIRRCWNFNLVRVDNVISADYGDRGWTHTHTNDDLDAIVAAFTARHIVVMLEAHDAVQLVDEGHGAEVAAWWQRAAERYRANPYVWFNVANEPGRNVEAPPTRDWLDFTRSLVAPIRATGARNLIVVDGASWGQDAAGGGTATVDSARSALLTFGPELVAGQAGIVFSVHAWEQWNDGGTARLDDFFERVRKVAPVIVGEYGTHNNSDATPAARAVVAVTSARRIGRVVWAWQGVDENNLTVASEGNWGGHAIDDCRKPTNLTELGRLVWDDNHRADPPVASAAAAGP